MVEDVIVDLNKTNCESGEYIHVAFTNLYEESMKKEKKKRMILSKKLKNV
jgi:hypothetical protein